MSLEIQPVTAEDEPGRPNAEQGTDHPASATKKPAPSTAADQRPSAQPVLPAERFFAVDVLRGFALLGILAMNIVLFGWPSPAYSNPMRGGGFTGIDRAIWFFNHLVFEAKMMTIFSMLFGAGLVLMDQRAEARGARIGWIYYRRIFWLLMIGLVHSYLIWDGDILVLYAQTGFFLFFFRNARPRTLIVLGVVAMLVIVPIVWGLGAGITYLKDTTARVDAQIKAGEKPDLFEKQLRDIWTTSLRDEITPNAERKAKDWNEELSIYRGSYPGIVKYKAFRVLMEQIVGFLIGGGLFAASRMLVGMGLMKLGVFSAQRSDRFYAWMLVLGYGLGLPLLIFDGVEMIKNEFSFDYFIMDGGVNFNLVGSLIVALGHVGLVMLIVKKGALQWLTKRLAAVGRMALSNYLFDSIFCTTLFYGYGFGLFGHVNRTGLAGIVLAIWVFQLLVSPIWLAHFRYGPAEWLWRSLTYWRLQPLRQERDQPLGTAA